MEMVPAIGRLFLIPMKIGNLIRYTPPYWAAEEQRNVATISYILVQVISNGFFLLVVMKESICWRSLAAQMWKTWHRIHASCCRSAPSSANWTRWSVTWPPSVSCRWPHGRGPARRRTSWHPGNTCTCLQYAHTVVQYICNQNADLGAACHVWQCLLFDKERSSFLFCISNLYSSLL